MRTLTIGLLVLFGCGGPDEDEPAPPTPSTTEVEPAAPARHPAAPMHPDESPVKPSVSPDSPVGRLRAYEAEILRRKEHGAPFVVVQQILVAVKGSGKNGATRTPEEAEAFTAKLLAEIQDGKPLAYVARNNSDDTGSGRYTITPETRASRYVKGFGDVAWRLAVGEVGVVPYDSQTSPLGYHILQRTQ